MNPPDICPICGADVPANATACPQCGACEKTGWSEEGRYSNLNLPDDSFDYDPYVAEEFGSGRHLRPRGLSWFWWAVGLALLGLLLFGLRQFK